VPEFDRIDYVSLTDWELGMVCLETDPRQNIPPVVIFLPATTVQWNGNLETTASNIREDERDSLPTRIIPD
jgi:hypothetical protein